MPIPDLLGLLGTNTEHADLTPPPPEAVVAPEFSDEELLELWADMRKESFEGRHVFERQWQRNIYYVLNRQWIEYQQKYGGWRDKRMAQWIPRPVTNKCKEAIQTIRAMFTTITLGVNVRPNGNDPKNVSAASTADDLAPVLYEVHDMDHVLSEFDFWLCVTGNAFIHGCVDYDIKHGMITVTGQECLGCGQVTSSTELLGAQPACPSCGGTEFQPAMDEMGMPIETQQVKGAPTTIVLSPLELAFPNSYARFSDLPYVIRLRWRTKHYFERHPTLKAMVNDISWGKSPSNPSLQMFRSLSTHNDLGVSTGYFDSMQAESQEDGIAEYEVSMKPTEKYPQGLMFRVIGDSEPKILRLEDTEAIPGPLPYHDAEGKPLFTFAHAGYEHVGGRILASGALDPIIQKQDQLNQLDSMILLIIQRMSNPVWLEPKGAEIERLTGMPGLVIKWNPLTVGGQAKPERIEGIGPPAALFQIREQYLKDIEELTGTYDIMKGAKPAGVEAFSAMQLLVERSQARFASVFKARGQMFKDWFKFAIELEREFGPDERTKATLEPTKTWTFQNFKRAQLEGAFSIIVDDGSTVPKTNLGMRAAVEHAAALGMLNMMDPDQQYEGLKLFGLTKMVPSLDYHVQAALQQDMMVYQQEAEQAITAQTEAAGAATPLGQPIAPPQLPPPPSITAHTPLELLPWFDPIIHRQEFVKWANSDRIREMLADPKTAQVKAILAAALAELDAKIAEKMMQAAMMGGPGGPPQKPGGSAMAMKNSNRESTSGNEPGGPGQPPA
jgi:hypothetical protein